MDSFLCLSRGHIHCSSPQHYVLGSDAATASGWAALLLRKATLDRAQRKENPGKIPPQHRQAGNQPHQGTEPRANLTHLPLRLLVLGFTR